MISLDPCLFDKHAPSLFLVQSHHVLPAQADSGPATLDGLSSSFHLVRSTQAG